MNEQDELMLLILARTDATFGPMRKPDWSAGDAAGVILERQTEFHRRGIPGSSSGANESDRKRHQRILDVAVGDGLVIAADGPAGKRSHIKLTDAADVAARELCWLPGLPDAFHVVKRCIELSDGWVSELWLSGLDCYDATARCESELRLTVDSARPALCRGWLDSNSDCHGRVWYRVTAAGRTVALGPAPTPPTEQTDKAAAQAAAAIYEADLVGYRQRLRTQSTEHAGELGRIPLSCSLDLQPKRPIRRAPGAPTKTRASRKVR